MQVYLAMMSTSTSPAGVDQTIIHYTNTTLHHLRTISLTDVDTTFSKDNAGEKKQGPKKVESDIFSGKLATSRHSPAGRAYG